MHTQGSIKHQQRLPHGVYDVLRKSLDRFQICRRFGNLFFGATTLRHVFHGKYKKLTVVAGLEFAGIKEHHSATNDRKSMYQLEVVKDRAFRDDIFQQSAQIRDVPLAVSELVD